MKTGGAANQKLGSCDLQITELLHNITFKKTLALTCWCFINRDANGDNQHDELPGHQSARARRSSTRETEQSFGAPHLSQQEPHAANTGLHTRILPPWKETLRRQQPLSRPPWDRLKSSLAAAFTSVALMSHKRIYKSLGAKGRIQRTGNHYIGTVRGKWLTPMG